MKLPARNLVGLLPFLLTACFHWTPQSRLKPYAPTLSAAPRPTATLVELPAAATTIPDVPLASDEESQLQQPKPIKHRRFGNRNTQQAASLDSESSAAAQQAANEAPEVSAIGQLSSGDPSDLRRQTADSITATERGLNGINRSLSDSEQKTAAQIREFLKQAREALATGDVDGAHTLAAKAKVLLSELAGT
jgi:hypothetical protein